MVPVTDDGLATAPSPPFILRFHFLSPSHLFRCSPRPLLLPGMRASAAVQGEGGLPKVSSAGECVYMCVRTY